MAEDDHGTSEQEDEYHENNWQSLFKIQLIGEGGEDLEVTPLQAAEAFASKYLPNLGKGVSKYLLDDFTQSVLTWLTTFCYNSVIFCGNPE